MAGPRCTDNDRGIERILATDRMIDQSTHACAIMATLTAARAHVLFTYPIAVRLVNSEVDVVHLMMW